MQQARLLREVNHRSGWTPAEKRGFLDLTFPLARYDPSGHYDAPYDTASGLAMIAGGCLCGAVRYETKAEPITARLCWCRHCQYIATGNAAVSVCFLKARMTMTGETRDYESVADSGSRMHRRFCPTCGTQMFSEAESRPHLIFVRAGTLDDPNVARPAATIWTAQAPKWACVDASLPSWEGQPPPAT